MGGYEFVVASLVNGEMLPLALWSIEWKGSLVSHGFYTRGGGGSPGEPANPLASATDVQSSADLAQTTSTSTIIPIT